MTNAHELLDSVFTQKNSMSENEVKGIESSFRSLLNLNPNEHQKIKQKIRFYGHMGLITIDQSTIDLERLSDFLRKKTKWNAGDALEGQKVIETIHLLIKKSDDLICAYFGHRSNSLSNALYRMDKICTYRKFCDHMLNQLDQPFYIDSKNEIQHCKKYEQTPEPSRFLIGTYDRFEPTPNLTFKEWFVVSLDRLIREIIIKHQVNLDWYICQCIGKYNEHYVFKLIRAYKAILEPKKRFKQEYKSSIVTRPRGTKYSSHYLMLAQKYLSQNKGRVLLIPIKKSRIAHSEKNDR